MAKLTLCMLNSQYIHAAPTPWCLKKGVEEFATRSHTVTVFEGTVNEAETALYDRLNATAPQVVGFCCYIWNISMVEKLIAHFRANHPEMIIILGGPEATHRAEELLCGNRADYVICGEGEVALPRLLDALDTQSAPAEIPGVWYQCEGQTVQNGIAVSEQLPPPYQMEEYIRSLHGRIAYAETSRGCPFSCDFCLSGRTEPVRFYPVEESLQRLIALANSGTQTVKLVDRTFNCNRTRTYELIDGLLRHRGVSFPETVCFHFEIAADLFDEQTLQRLEEAPTGLFQMEAGIQSFHPETLEAISRKTDTDKLYQILQRLIRMGNMHIHVDLIAGLPYEDEECFAASFDRAYRLQPHMLQFGFLKLLYGTRLRRDAEKYGFVAENDAPYEIRSTHWLSAETLQQIHQTEDVLERTYNSGRFRRTMDYVLGASKLTPYALYSTLGRRMQNVPGGTSLDDYTQLLWQACLSLPGVEEQPLRSAMVRDRLASIRGGKMPPVLRRTDDRFPHAMRAMHLWTGIPTGAFGGAILYDHEECVIAADYRHKDPVSGQYPMQEANLATLLQEIQIE